MSYFGSNVTSKHKLVRVVTQPPKYSRDELLPGSENVIVGKRSLVDDIMKTYVLLGGEMTDSQIPIVMGFKSSWGGVYREQTISTLIRGIGDKYIVDDGKMFVVAAPPAITQQMSDSYKIAWIAPTAPDISLGLLGL